MSAPMGEREALALVQRLLVDALARDPKSEVYVRHLAAHVGRLEASMTAALTVIELATGEADQ